MKKKMRQSVKLLVLTFILTFFAGGLAVRAAGSFYINLRNATVNIGDSDNKLLLEIKGLSEGDRKPKWSSWNENIAKVDQEGDKGVVTALRKGKAVISSGIGFPRETCVVTVVEPSIKLNKTAAAIYYGEQERNCTAVQLKAAVKGARMETEWSSSDENVAAVDAAGRVTAKAPGKAVITAAANGRTASCTITVLENRLSLNIGKMQLSTKGTGSTMKLIPTVVGADKKVTWASSNTAVASVKGGRVAGKSTGTAVITAKANGLEAACEVIVTEGLVSINEEHVQLYITGKNGNGETKQLKTNASKTDTVTWDSDNSETASVYNGLVTAKKAGTAIITAACSNKTDTCVVEVKDTETIIKERIVHLKTKGTAKTFTLGYEVIGRKKAVKWSSSNKKVVTVSKGKLKAKKAGIAVITAEANGTKDTVVVTVDEFTPAIAINQSEYTLYTKGRNNAVALKAVIDGPVKKAVWSSSDERVAAVAANGKVTAKGKGRALITAAANGVKAKCWIHVKESEIVIEKEYILLNKGDKEALSVEITGASQSAKYTTTNPKAVKVNNKGVITAKNSGTAEIKVKANGVTKSCYVMVTDCKEHDWKPISEEDRGKYDKTATCLERGLATQECSKCHGKMQKVIPPAGHQFGRWTIEVKATETAPGLEKQVCKVCGEENTRTIPPKGRGEGTGSYEKGELVWADEFDGDKLNAQDWNIECRDPGWSNAELQAYVDSGRNIYVEDGSLYIQAVKEVKDGRTYYTSGRINTQNKHDFKYGRFEIRAKVPSGKGFLPAFWMLPSDESLYGQWPESGEIDIMEVYGSAVKTSFGTLHFGEPHIQKQGSYTLPSGQKNFAEDFHVYACEWDPGEFRFYVDDTLFYTVNDWFTQRPGFGKAAYPAPYDQPFYMILNLAVGGNRAGALGEDIVFGDNAQFVIDYVRVYQKDSYDTDVSKPENDVQLREPDSTGNYIINGDFSKIEDLEKADSNWQLLLSGGGEAAASISGNALHVTSTNAGTLNNGILAAQANLPVENGVKYKLTYDAWADAERTMITGISAPNRGYVRYLEDKTVELTTERKSYEHVFDMTNDSDANGRVEFNLGNQGSLAAVHITNVRLVKDGSVEKKDKGMLPDGNYVYNGQFNEGDERLAYWDWDWDAGQCRGTSISVTNDSRHELKVVVPDTVSSIEQAEVYQDPVAIGGGKKFIFTFDAYADRNKTIKTELAGHTFESALTTERQTFQYMFETPENLKGSKIRFLLGTAGTTYIDNVCVKDDNMIINGDFSSGMLGYEVNVDAAAKVSEYKVDSENEKDAFLINITDTGDQAWQIQLKRSDIRLEKDKWYRFSFDAKAAVDREIMYVLQRDGTKHKDNNGAEDWMPYFGEPKAELTGTWQNFSTVFKMDYDTDPNTVLCISMGAVNGKQISEMHSVLIDNIKLEETEPVEEPPVSPGDNLIKNGDFSNKLKNFDVIVDETAAAKNIGAENGEFAITITDTGDAGWKIQLKQAGIKLEKGKWYELSFDAASTLDRSIKYTLQKDGSEDWKVYGEASADLTAEPESFKKTFRMTEATDEAAAFSITMGADGENQITRQHTITIDNIVLKETEPVETPPAAPGDNLIKNGDFANKLDSFEVTVDKTAAAKNNGAKNGEFAITITDTGDAGWKIQLKQADIKLEKDKWYELSFDAASTLDRSIRCALQRDGSKHKNPDGSEDWTEYYYKAADLSVDTMTFKEMFRMTEETDEGAIFGITMGADGENQITKKHIITIDNIVLKEIDPVEEPPESSDDNLIKNGDFANKLDSFEVVVDKSAAASDNGAKNGELAVTITDTGDAGWKIQLKQADIRLEKDKWYELSFDASSTMERNIKYALQRDGSKHTTPDGGEDWKVYGEASADLTKRSQTFKKTFRMTEETDEGAVFTITMGAAGENQTEEHTITIDNIVLKETEPVEEPPQSKDDNLIKNGGFANKLDSFEVVVDKSAAASNNGANSGELAVTITDTGDAGWKIQLKQAGIKLEKGKWYELSFDASSTMDRTIKYALQRDGSKHMTSDGGEDWRVYGESEVELTAEFRNIKSQPFKMTEETDAETIFTITMGAVDQNQITRQHTITIDNIVLKETAKPAASESSVSETGMEDEPEQTETESTGDNAAKETETTEETEETGETETTEETEEAGETETAEETEAAEETESAFALIYDYSV